MRKNEVVLIIEDEESIMDILTYALRKEGYVVHGAGTGEAGLRLFEGVCPDVVILDLMLPDTSGFELCKQFRRTGNTPLMMLTARDDIVDKLLGLELGADDYMTKPFDIREVLARVKALLRRQNQSAFSSYIEINDLVRVEPRSFSVYKQEQPVALKPKEYDLLLLFAQNKNRVFSREEVLDTVWEFDYEGDVRTVDVHVQRIRKKLDHPERPSIIETVFGVGYKMRGQ